MLESASSDRSRLWAGAPDDDKGLYSVSDEINVGLVGITAYVPVNVLTNDETEAATREGLVNTQYTHGRDAVACKVTCDEIQHQGLGHVYAVPKLDPDMSDLLVRRRVEINSYTMDIGGGNLAGTHIEALGDDHCKVRDIRWFAAVVNKDIDLRGHGGSYRLLQNRTRVRFSK
jgi:hypothetical protein